MTDRTDLPLQRDLANAFGDHAINRAIVGAGEPHAPRPNVEHFARSSRQGWPAWGTRPMPELRRDGGD
jgi:hypothetical protein